MIGSLLPLAACLAMVTAPAAPPPRGEWRSSELRVQQRTPVLSFEELREIGLQYVGRPYVRAGVGSPGFDCSGLTCRIFAEAGYPLPRTSREQAQVGREIPLDDIAPGDLLFFAKPRTKRVEHVGVYLGGGEMLHAATGRGRVIISDLSERWYRQRIVGARRILPESRTSSEALAVRSALLGRGVRELDEHAGDELPLTLRLPRDEQPPRLGAALGSFEATSIGVRAAVVTEGQEPGIVIAPEASFVAESVGFEATVAVPIRFNVGGSDGSASVGEVRRAVDVLRFLRGASLGLRGAELELRLERFGDFGLGPGLTLDRLQPSAGVRGIVGLTLARTPLTFSGGYRSLALSVDALIDDVVDPGVLGFAARFPLVSGWLALSAAGLGDLRAGGPSGPSRPLWAGEVALSLDAVSTPAWSVQLAGLAGLQSHEDPAAERTQGGAAGARVDAEYRFSRAGDGTVSVRLEGGHAWAGFVPELFGPTYAGARAPTLALLDTTGDRFGLGGELSLRVGRFVLSGGHRDALGSRAEPLERRTFGLVEVRDLAFFGTTLADLRVAYAARGLFRDSVVDVLHGGLRVRFRSWLYAEAYLAKATGVEGGVGLVGAFIP